MVLQRAPQRAVVWGFTDTPNASIILNLNKKIYSTMSSSVAGESIWSVTLDAQEAEGPFQIQVTQPLANGTKVTIILNDVLFGDVWLCSGQSNMEFPVLNMLNASIEIANAGKYPKIRLLSAAHELSYQFEQELLGISLNWTAASPTSVGSPFTSAICWLYGRMVHEALGGRPMGLVHTSWGGTAIETWTPPNVLQDCNVTS